MSPNTIDIATASDRASEAEAILDAVRSCLDGQSFGNVHVAWLQGSGIEPETETGAHVGGATYSVWYQED